MSVSERGNEATRGSVDVNRDIDPCFLFEFIKEFRDLLNGFIVT